MGRFWIAWFKLPVHTLEIKITLNIIMLYRKRESLIFMQFVQGFLLVLAYSSIRPLYHFTYQAILYQSNKKYNVGC